MKNDRRVSVIHDALPAPGLPRPASRACLDETNASLPRVDAVRFREQFPVCEQLAYLNAGTCGPLPGPAVGVATRVLEESARSGRAGMYFEQMLALATQRRAAYAALLNAQPEDVALTTSTSEGVVRVVTALDLRPGDEVLTSDEEHPGVLGPLLAARAQRGIVVRTVPFERLADAATPATRLIACSHVSWINGRLAPDFSGLDVPVLLDGAQGAGAVAVDVAALGCAFYAASGQKWLCGPVGTGLLWVSPEWTERLPAIGPTYINLEDPGAGLEAELVAGAARFDTPSQSLEAAVLAATAFVLLASTGWDEVFERAASLAATLADALTARGLHVAPRDRTTLVSWHDDDPEATRERLAAAGVVIRDLPGTGLLRASVGAWNDEADLQRLLGAL
ncbi:MAG: L-cysteine/cystine lyase [Solirubrobacteraceae bacterium]|nr:L-cysteine/cystine lyase [Solirubrobacteraceae bacterium]